MKRKFLFVMFLCFIMGGYLILNFSTQVYTLWLRPPSFNNISVNDRFGEFNSTTFFRRAPAERAFSPQVFIDLISGIIFIVAGLSLWQLVREKEMGLVKDKLADMYLLPEEKSIVNELKKAGGEITQRELVTRTGLSKVKIHRVVNKLENKKIIKRVPYGMTRKIVMMESE